MATVNIDEAIERLEIDNSDDWVARPRVDSDDLRAVLKELKRLRTAPIEALERLRANADDLPVGTDERYQQGYRAGIADALTAVRAAVKVGAT